MYAVVQVEGTPQSRLYAQVQGVRPNELHIALDKNCKWPKWCHFIEADIQLYFILLYNRRYFVEHKAKNGDREIILSIATLTCLFLIAGAFCR